MATYIPAIRARMGQTEFYSSVLTFGEAARLIDYVEDVDSWTPETPSELKLQRKLNLPRVEREMVPYLVSTDDHFYSALTVEIRPAMGESGPRPIDFSTEQTFPGGVEFGMLTMDGTETLYALDGQHRLKSIEIALRERPELAGEHIAVIMIPFKSTTTSQLLFSDLNRYARNPSRSISLLFAHRDPVAKISKALADAVPLLKDRVNMESTSLSVNTPYFITLSTLYEVTKSLLPDKWPESPNENQIDRQVSAQVATWEKLTSSIEQWAMVLDDVEHPAYLRQRYLNMHGVGQRAIANTTARLRTENPRTWIKELKQISGIDWRIANDEWQGVAVQGGRVNNTSTSIRLLSAAVSAKIGLKIDPAMAETLATAGVTVKRNQTPRRRRGAPRKAE